MKQEGYNHTPASGK